MQSLRYAGMLHDVGKLGVPTRVLQKNGGLTEGECASIQLHPVQGVEIIREIEFLDEAVRRHPAPPRAARRPRLPDGPGAATTSRSSPG